jgi:hypothetical protein
MEVICVYTDTHIRQYKIQNYIILNQVVHWPYSLLPPCCKGYIVSSPLDILSRGSENAATNIKILLTWFFIYFSLVSIF